jgi:hypothetical protein
MTWANSSVSQEDHDPHNCPASIPDIDLYFNLLSRCQPCARPDSLAQSVPHVIRTMPPVIVIGFVGGFIRHDNLVHSEVQLAARLRKAYPTGVDVETFESYHGEEAREKILSLLDTNHDGILTAAEKNGRIIIYGHRWGGSEAIALARKLEKDGIPVLLCNSTSCRGQSGDHLT